MQRAYSYVECDDSLHWSEYQRKVVVRIQAERICWIEDMTQKPNDVMVDPLIVGAKANADNRRGDAGLVETSGLGFQVLGPVSRV